MFKITKTIYVRPDGKRTILHHEVCVEDLEEYKRKCHPNKGEKVLLEYEDLSNPAPPEPAPLSAIYALRSQLSNTSFKVIG